MTCLTGLKLRTNPNCLASTLRVEALKVLPVGSDVQLVELNNCLNVNFTLEFVKKLCKGSYNVSLTDNSLSPPKSFLGVANYNNTKKIWNISVPFSFEFSLANFVKKDAITLSAYYQIELVKDKNCWKADFIYINASATQTFSEPPYGEFDVIANVSRIGSLTFKKSC